MVTVPVVLVVWSRLVQVIRLELVWMSRTLPTWPLMANCSPAPDNFLREADKIIGEVTGSETNTLACLPAGTRLPFCCAMSRRSDSVPAVRLFQSRPSAENATQPAL